MISSSLKALTHVATRSFWRFRIINNYLIKPTYFTNIQASNRFYYNTPGQSINTKNFSETSDRKDENVDSYGNRISNDDKNKNKNFSQPSPLKHMSETTYGMPSSETNVVDVSDKSRVTNKIDNQKNLSEQQNRMKKQFDQNNKDKDKDRNLNNSSINNVFHEANQDENFHNTYVGDVEFKIPSQQSPINEDLSMKNQKENEMDYQKPIQSQNYNQSNNSYNINDNMGMENSNEKYSEDLSKKVTDTNVDLDLSSENFQQKMEEYKQNSSNDNTKESSKSYSNNKDYFLKDNNSEYNNYISNQPDTGFVEEDNLNNYNKTSNNYSSNKKPEIISSKNSNKNENMNKQTPQSKYSLFPSEKDREIEFDVNESLQGQNVTGRDDTAIDKDEEPAKDHNMYHNKGHLFPNH